MSLRNFADSDMFNHFKALREFIYGVISLSLRILRELRFLVHIAGKFRRFFLVHFRKNYTSRQLLVRDGACRQCGTCCNLLITCPMLTKRGSCLIYGICRPQACKVFPIDQRDIDEIELCGRVCGYSFNNRHEDVSFRRDK